MTLDEFCNEYGYSKETLHRSFRRTIETMKKKGLILTRTGTWSNGDYQVYKDEDFKPQQKEQILQTRLIGQRFGHLVVQKDTGKRLHRSVIWECLCDCGRTHLVTSNNLNGGTKSCGYKDCPYYVTYKDLAGQKFGKLTALYPTSMKDGSHMYWMCKCDCGNPELKEVAANHLQQGSVQSCGCIKKSIGEMNIEKILQENNIPFQTQVTFPDLKNIKSLRYDFGIYDPMTNSLVRLVEFDGIQHFKEQEYFSHTLEENQTNDIIKNDYARSKNIPLVRIPYTERDKITLDMILGKEFLVE